MTRTVSTASLLILGSLLTSALLLTLGYSYGAYTTRAELGMLYSSAPYYLEAVFLTVVFLLPGAGCLVAAGLLRRGATRTTRPPAQRFRRSGGRGGAA